MIEPRGPNYWANQQAAEREQARPGRKLLDQMSDAELTALYAERDRYRLAWTGARRRAQNARAAWRTWFRLANKRKADAEAKLARVRAIAEQLASEEHLAAAYADAARRIRAALDEPKESRT